MKRAPILFLIAAAFALASIAVLLVGVDRQQPSGRADWTDPDQVALGERVYREHCAACHGVELEGQPNWQSRRPDGRLPAPPHDETGHTWHHADAFLFRITKDGVSTIVPGYESDMPAYADLLTDRQIWAVLAFIKSRWPPRIQAIQADIDRQDQWAR